jgi:hypothetical protein
MTAGAYVGVMTCAVFCLYLYLINLHMDGRMLDIYQVGSQ